MNFKQKLTTGMAAGTMLASMLSTAAFADTTVVVADNGRGSENTAVVKEDNTQVVGQLNVMLVENNVTTSANTGGNEVNNNTGRNSDTSIRTGDASNTVLVTNTGGSNVATVESCGCDDDTTVRVRDNGRNSTNTVKVKKTNNNWFLQGNVLAVSNNVETKAKTGNNKIKNNTGRGSDRRVRTGDADNSAKIHNTGGSNVLTVTP